MSENPSNGPYGIAAIVIAVVVIGLAAYGVFALIDAAGGIACDS